MSEPTPANASGNPALRGPWRYSVRRGAMPLAAASALLAACGSPVVSSADIAESTAVTLQGPSDDDDAAPGVHDGFHVTVRTDWPRYRASEEVTFTVETCNLGTPTTVEEGGPPFGFTIRDAAGRVVADDSHVLSALALLARGVVGGRRVPGSHGELGPALLEPP
jgi:hypothetical protein